MTEKQCQFGQCACTQSDTSDMKHIKNAWSIIGPFLTPPKNDDDLDNLIKISLSLVKHISKDETHPLTDLFEMIGNLIEGYDG